MAVKLLKTMVIAGICFLATTGLSLACSFEFGTMTNHFHENSLWTGTSENMLFEASIVSTAPWDPEVWRDHIIEYTTFNLDALYPTPRVADNDGIGGLLFFDMFIIHGTGHAWFSHILFGRNWKESNPNVNAWADLVESRHWRNELPGNISDVAPVPEPATLLLLGTGLIGLGGLGRKKMHKNQAASHSNFVG